MQFKYILYLIFLSLFACEHHSSNINIKNKPEEAKPIVQKKEIKEIEKIKKKPEEKKIIVKKEETKESLDIEKKKRILILFIQIKDLH